MSKFLTSSEEFDLEQIKLEWRLENEEMARFIKNCGGRRAFAIRNGSSDKECNIPWFVIGFLCYFFRRFFFILSNNAFRIFDNNYPLVSIFPLISILFPMYYFMVVYHICDIGPVVDYHEMGRGRKTAMVVISSCAALILRLLLEDIYYGYMLVTVTAELQAYFQLLYSPRDHSFWDVFFVASLQIIIINLKDGNILIFISALLLIGKLLLEKFRSYSTPISKKED
ncbi:hypothetical protein MANES_07G135801v8 [Manihot esculenta]|uniref:Uncharacterized protein n=1 Tax=Manihot esculenta TaxID=3983 RepID=A0ACB7HKX4_MANES|nr:hypothetical protein MANES_07G135801v8 [Manihot esculenta]